MFAGSMPNSSTSLALVETATKCLATARRRCGRPVPAEAVEQPPPGRLRVGERLQRGERLGRDDEQRLRRVEVGVFSHVGRVDVGDEPAPGTGPCSPCNASYAITGPRSEPPMPMLTTLRIRRPVAPVHCPDRTRSAKAPIRSSTSCTSATTSWPSTPRVASRGRRSAVCRTARSSVMLMCSPPNIPSIVPQPGLRPAESRRRVCVGDPVLRVVDVQIRRPTAIARPRPGPREQLPQVPPAHPGWCPSRASHSGVVVMSIGATQSSSALLTCRPTRPARSPIIPGGRVGCMTVPAERLPAPAVCPLHGVRQPCSSEWGRSNPGAVRARGRVVFLAR